MFCVVRGPHRGVYGCFVGEDGPAGGERWRDYVPSLCVVLECMFSCGVAICVVLECMLPEPGAWRFAEVLIHVHFGKFLH